MIVQGKNVLPQDVEDAVSSVTGVIAGRNVAFGVFREEEGTEWLYRRILDRLDPEPG